MRHKNEGKEKLEDYIKDLFKKLIKNEKKLTRRWK